MAHSYTDYTLIKNYRNIEYMTPILGLIWSPRIGTQGSQEGAPVEDHAVVLGEINGDDLGRESGREANLLAIIRLLGWPL